MDIMRQKVVHLTQEIEDAIGVRPRSHRAGKWVINESYIRILADLGYRVDCSVTPHVNWNKNQGKGKYWRPITLPDYRQFPDQSYFLNGDDISREGDLDILEIPMTIVPSYGAVRQALYDHVRNSYFRRGFRGVFGQPLSWFRPNKNGNLNEMIRIAKRQMRSGSSYLMFMLHSSEFMPGGSPMFPTNQSVDKLYTDLRKIFRWLHRNNVTGKTCRDFYDHVQAKGEP